MPKIETTNTTEGESLTEGEIICKGGFPTSSQTTKIEMSVKLEGQKELYNPKDSDLVECYTHGVKKLWGELSPIAKLSVEEGLDTVEDCECLLLSKF